MKHWIFFCALFLPAIIHATPRNPFPKTPDQTWQNDLDLQDEIKNIGTFTINCSSVPCLNGSGFVPNSEIDGSSITKQGNTFNGNSQLVKTDAVGAISVSSMNVTGNYWQAGFKTLQIIKVQEYTTATSSNTLGTTFVNTTLNGSFTPQLSTSKILILVSSVLSQNVGDGGYLTIARNGTNLSGSSAGYFATVSGNNYDLSMFGWDAPATTSAITYSVQFRTAGGGATIVMPVTLGGITPVAHMLIFEIAQ